MGLENQGYVHDLHGGNQCSVPTTQLHNSINARLLLDINTDFNLIISWSHDHSVFGSHWRW